MVATSNFYPEDIKWDPYFGPSPPMNIPYSSCTNQNPTTYSNQIYSDMTSDYQNPNYNHQSQPNLTVCTNFPQNSNEGFCQNYSSGWGNFEDTQVSFSPRLSASLTSQCSSAVPNPPSNYSDFKQIDSPYGFSSASSHCSSMESLNFQALEHSLPNSNSNSPMMPIRRKRGRKPEFAHLPERERQQIKKNKNKEAQRRSRRTKKEQFHQKEIELKQALQRIEEFEQREEQYKMEMDGILHCINWFVCLSHSTNAQSRSLQTRSVNDQLLDGLTTQTDESSIDDGGALGQVVFLVVWLTAQKL
ncbi:hypothetical protein WR25_05662 [Diploscapter pachys]|uniref:BZIP domain-containing protein n=1 Tax=Diploscapter pachys TaxID=2018661 RepID=A0A2A2LVI0_9BILA|nr:hypothetical protein WR25_05662 [Diploscapter pachys]